MFVLNTENISMQYKIVIVFTNAKSVKLKENDLLQKRANGSM